MVLDKNIRLIDSPGVVFDDKENAGAGAVLRNCVDADSISDPVPAVEELLNRATVESIMMTYNVPAFPKGDVMTFLAMAARSKGKVLKGGIPDKVMAARMVLKDWNKGKIPYYSVPPSSDGMAVDVSGGGGEAVLVSGFSEEFDVNKILAAHDAELMEGLEEKDEMDFVAVSSGAVEGGKNADRVLNYLKGDEDEDSSEGSDEDMEEDEDDVIAANKCMEDPKISILVTKLMQC